MAIKKRPATARTVESTCETCTQALRELRQLSGRIADVKVTADSTRSMVAEVKKLQNRLDELDEQCLEHEKRIKDRPPRCEDKAVGDLIVWALGDVHSLDRLQKIVDQLKAK